MVKTTEVFIFYGSVSYLVVLSHRKEHHEVGGGIQRERCDYLHLTPNWKNRSSFVLLVRVFSLRLPASSSLLSICQFSLQSTYYF